MISMSSFGVAIPCLLFFLETMQDEHCFLELHGVDRTIRAAGIVFDDFQHTGTAEALHHFRCVVSVHALGEIQGMTKEPAHLHRRRHQILLAATQPDEQLFVGAHDRKYT